MIGRRSSGHALLSASLLVAALSVFLLQTRVFRGDAITTDEGSYLFQARIFAAGRLWAPAPLERNILQFRYWMINLTEDRWFSRYAFGHPLALVPGVALGNPLVVPFVLAIGSALIVFRLGRVLYDQPTAVVAVVLTALSPYYLAMHATLLSHTTTLFALALFTLACAKARESPRIRWGMLAGASLGFAFNTRPYTSLLVAWPFLLWCGWQWLRARSAVLAKQAAGFVCFFGLFLAAYFLYNRLTTGEWLLSPFTLYNPTERIGFVYVRQMEMHHTPLDGWNHTVDNLDRLNRWWLGFPGSLAVLGGLAIRRPRWPDAVLFASGLSLIVGYFFFYFRGVSTVGPAYYYESVLPLGLLGARGLMNVWRSGLWSGMGRWKARHLLAVAVGVIWLGCLASFWREQVPRLTRQFARQRAFAAAVAAADPRNAIVLIPSDGPAWHRVRLEPFGWREILFVRSRRGRDERVMNEVPHRSVYRYENETLVRIR